MAEESGYDPTIIENFTKITDLEQIEQGKNYLVKYFGQYNVDDVYTIGKFIEKEKDCDRDPAYFFKSLYYKKYVRNPWRVKNEYGNVAFGHYMNMPYENLLPFKEKDINTTPTPPGEIEIRDKFKFCF